VNGPASVRGTTRTAGIIGWPVELSLSPAIHNAAFAALDLDWIYVPLPVPPGEASAAIRGLRALGFAGANVTMPHKTDAADAMDTLSDDAQRLRAVNTIVLDADGIGGHNTDAPGFDRFLHRDAGFDPMGRTAMILGAGGVARATALALARAPVADLIVAVREPARAGMLLDALEGLDVEVRVVGFDGASAETADLVVNATPVGSVPLPHLIEGAIVVDLRYHPALTDVQSVARAAGATAFGGLGLLLHQAALSFELWTGQAAPLDVMSAAALATIAELDRSAG
jgi:shikimate dehydrogenase